MAWGSTHGNTQLISTTTVPKERQGHKASSIIIAIFICKNPDIKRNLSVFPGFPFLQKQKGTYKPSPLSFLYRVFSGSPPPAPPLQLHASFQDVWLPTCFGAFLPG